MQTLTEIAERVARQLMERGETVAVAESSAGGLISAALLAVPGASLCFVGGGVIYTGKARQALLGIVPEDMIGLEPATEPYAALLAHRVRSSLGTDWGVGESGAAGPTGNRYGDPAGHCCLAIFGTHEVRHTLATGSADRAANMQEFAQAALSLLHRALDKP